MENCKIMVHENLVVADENNTKIILGNDEDSQKIYVLKEFECELLERMKKHPIYDDLLEDLTDSFSGEGIQEDLDQFLSELQNAGIVSFESI